MTKAAATLLRRHAVRHNSSNFSSERFGRAAEPFDSSNKLGDFCMQKKLLAVAVAGALALPGAASAASSVTITGFFKLSYAYIKVSDQPQGFTGKTSEDRVQDESSRIYFRVVEDLGGGLQAIGQVDWRIALDSAVSGASGANWVGLRSKSWGDVTMGRHDLHYIYTEDQSYSRGGSLKGTNTSIIAYSAGGVFAIANATRTPRRKPRSAAPTATATPGTSRRSTTRRTGASATATGPAKTMAIRLRVRGWARPLTARKSRRPATASTPTTSGAGSASASFGTNPRSS